MSDFKVIIVGSGSAMQSINHMPSAQIIKYGTKYFLIDCADGTTKRLVDMHIPIQKIDSIFISHEHGDHCYGLMSLIDAMFLGGRRKRLTIFAPDGFENRFGNDWLSKMKDGLPFDIDLVLLDANNIKNIYSDGTLTVETIPLKHGVPCCGYLFREVGKPRHIRPDAIEKYKIPYNLINSIKKDGIDYTRPDGTVIKNEDITTPPDRSYSYAYCSDTSYNEDMFEQIKGVTVLYHEVSFMEKDRELAEKYHHSTSKDAALTAEKSSADKLLIGHISVRYKEDSEVLDEVRKFFLFSDLAEEKKEYDIEKMYKNKHRMENKIILLKEQFFTEQKLMITMEMITNIFFENYDNVIEFISELREETFKRYNGKKTISIEGNECPTLLLNDTSNDD